MFEGLRHKWKVNGLQLGLILVTFAIGGSITGYAGRKIMNLVPVDARWAWLLLYIIIIIILWPVAVLLVSLFTGQFRFFIKYIQRMGIRMKIIPAARMSKTHEHSRGINPATSGIRLAIFASGAGSNAQKIIDHFRGHSSIHVGLILCNNPQAGVLMIAEKENIPAIIIEKEKFFRGNHYVDELKEYQIGFIVLAGFLWKLPVAIIQAFPGRIVNIHPALLPNYGGKGMYGDKVHAAVIAAGEKRSGITIHYVDEHYDNGDIIFQATCEVYPGDTPMALAARIHRLEHENFPRVIEEVIAGIQKTGSQTA